MQYLSEIYAQLLASSGLWGLAAAMLTVAMLVVQLYYLIGVAGSIPKFRNHRPDEDPQDAMAPVSVVIVAASADFGFIENTLPSLLAQDYENFEIVVVNTTGEVDFTETLTAMAAHNPRLVVTSMPHDERFVISNKMALNVGIKAAHHNNLLFTTLACTPSSERWISLMAKGFAGGEVVIGYSNLEPRPGVVNKLMRMDRLGVSCRWLARAMRGKPYAGGLENVGFTKELYFKAGGFNHLNLNMGEDSLFLRTIATGDNTSVVATPKSTVRNGTPYTKFRQWFAYRKFSSYAYRFYDRQVKCYVGMELWSRGLFFAAALATLVITPFEIKLAILALVVLRAALVLFQYLRICKRLAEPKLGWGTLLFYDLLTPPYEAALALWRRLKPSQGIWK